MVGVSEYLTLKIFMEADVLLLDSRFLVVVFVVVLLLITNSKLAVIKIGSKDIS